MMKKHLIAILTCQGDRFWNTDYQNDEIYAPEIYSYRKYSRKNERYAEVEFTSDLINFGPGTLSVLERYIAEPVDRSSQEIIDVTYSEEPGGFKEDKWDRKWLASGNQKFPRVKGSSHT